MKRKALAKPLRLVIHGGAGVVRRANGSIKSERAIHLAMATALAQGYKILQAGGSSVDVVVETIKFLENTPLFNAGLGSTLTKAGTIECDAALMDGKTLKAGAVGCVSRIQNPIALARLIMETTPHVMLVGPQAEQFAKSKGMKLIASNALITPEQRKAWQVWKPAKKAKLGTVGALALDHAGNLAAATSTGGIMHKMPGRIGDSPIIGAGTYAENQTCAVSATGVGEYFMRLAVAYDVAARIKYSNYTLLRAIKSEFTRLKKLGGIGGLIGLDARGNIAMEYNSDGMYCGYIDGKNLTTVID